MVCVLSEFQYPNDRALVGLHCTYTHHCAVVVLPCIAHVSDVPLTKREKAQAANIFHVLDINHDKKISRTEMYDLLHVVSDWAQTNNNHQLYLAVDRSVYTSYSDTNKDNYVSYTEFLAGTSVGWMVLTFFFCLTD